MNDSENPKAILDRLLDDAVTEGRYNWDGYYGHDNSYHLEELIKSDKYKQLVRLLDGVKLS